MTQAKTLHNFLSEQRKCSWQQGASGYTESSYINHHLKGFWSGIYIRNDKQQQINMVSALLPLTALSMEFTPCWHSRLFFTTYFPSSS